MLFIYYLSDGEIYQASSPEKNLEEFFGENRAKELSKVFGAKYMEYDDFIFYNFKKFKVVDGDLVIKDKTKFSFLLEEIING